MSQTTFLLAPCSSSDLPPSAPLALLPFSLGPSSSPYTSTTAPISQYFCPRPSAPSTSSSSSNASSHRATETTATFRGRQVVGQYIAVPPGYRGVILGTSKRPDRGGVEVRGSGNAIGSASGSGSGQKYPLTPSSSVSAPSVASTTNTAGAEFDLDGGRRRSTRAVASGSGSAAYAPGVKVKGAGQVALSKPRSRAPARTTTPHKRFRLDSDDSEEDEDADVIDGTERPSSNLTRTPSKRLKRDTIMTTMTTPQKPRPSAGDTMSALAVGEGTDGTPIPEIVVQEATPLKHPLPTPKKRLSRRRHSPSPSPVPVPVAAPRGEVDVEMPGDEEGTTEEREEREVQHVENVTAEQEQEQVIPSPATEEDPPAFDIPPTIKVESEVESAKMQMYGKERGTSEIHPFVSEPSKSTETEPRSETKPQIQVGNAAYMYMDEYEHEQEHDGPLRVLRPISTFDGFMLYTPDVALAGYRADELGPTKASEATITISDDGEGGTSLRQSSSSATLLNGTETEDQSQRPETLGEGEAKTVMTVREKTEGAAGTLKKGWWRSGGAGEGGDEVVRALGEWLGLNEILHAPVYLDTADLSDDDE